MSTNFGSASFFEGGASLPGQLAIADLNAALPAAPGMLLGGNALSGHTTPVTVGSGLALDGTTNTLTATGGGGGGSGVSSFNTRTGAVSLTSGDIAAALGFTPRNTDVANVLDYFAVASTDAALAMRNAIASGKRVIYVPPGDYTCSSTITPFGHAVDPACFELNAKSDTWIIAHGARFLIANSISGPTPAVTLSIGNNSKNCGVLGATFVGNQTGLTLGQENVGINLGAVTGVTLKDLKFTGSFTAAISGVFIFDTLIENVRAYKVCIGLDIAHTENLTIRDSRFVADPALPASGINHHYDTPTLADNVVTNEDGTARSLRGGQSNRLHVEKCAFEGFNNSLGIEEMVGATIRGNTLRGALSSGAFGTAGVLIYLSTAAATASLVMTDIEVSQNEITGHGVTATTLGGGILIASANVKRVKVFGNWIYDNTGYGLNASTSSGLAGLIEWGNTFTSPSGATSQTAPLTPGLVGIFTTDIGQGAWVISSAGATTTQTLVSTAPSTIGIFLNNTSFQWKDSGGTNRPILGVSPSNVTFLRSASDAAYFEVQNMSGTSIMVAGTGGIVLKEPVSIATGTTVSLGNAAFVSVPTVTTGDNSTNAASTAFVQASIAGATAGVASFNSRTGTVLLTTADVTGVLASGLPVANGGTGATTASAARTNLGVSTVGNTGAYADLTGKPTLGGAAALNVGTTTGTVAAGDDSRITGAQTASQVSTAIAAGTAANVSGTVAVANGGTGATSAATARTNLGVSAIAFGVDFSQGVVVANGTINVVRKAPFAMTINSLDYEVGSAGGSFTVAVQIAGTNVTGLSAVAVSSATSANAVASGANTVSAGQQVTIVISSTSGSPTGANLQINATR